MNLAIHGLMSLPATVNLYNLWQDALVQSWRNSLAPPSNPLPLSTYQKEDEIILTIMAQPVPMDQMSI